MTFSTGPIAFAQTVINTTASQAAGNVVHPPNFGTLGTPQINPGNNAYPMLYGTAPVNLATPGALPAQNQYMVVGAQAVQSGNNTVNGLAGYGNAQGNSQNQAARPDVFVPSPFSQIYDEILTMNNYTYRM